MANERKTFSIIQGGGRVYIGPPSTVVHPLASNTAKTAANVVGDLGVPPTQISKGGSLEANTLGWADAGYIDDEGVSLTIGNEMEVITEIESLWPIDVRKVSAGAMFRAVLMEASLDNLYNLGLSKVGTEFGDDVKAYKFPTGNTGTVAESSTEKIKTFQGKRFGGPDEHIPGVSVVFDGPAPAAGSNKLRRRRVFLPRAMNLTPIDLVSSKRGQTLIRLDLTVVMPDDPDFRPCYIVDQI